MYEHEYRERKNNGVITHVPMPVQHNQYGKDMYEYLESRDLSFELAEANGWYPTWHRGPRIVIPCINSANFNYWQARAMYEHPIRYDSHAIPRKDSIVFLWPKENHRLGGNTVVITEGPMDALAAAEFYPAIAVMGGAPSEEVTAFIERKTAELGLSKKLLVPDLDNFNFVDKFKGWFQTFIVMPTHKDLAAMPRWEREKLLKGASDGT